MIGSTNILSSARVVPLLAALIAACQMSDALFGTLTPWKGGGFGMFASVDGPLNRFLRVIVIDRTGGTGRVVIPNGGYPRPDSLSSAFLAQTVARPTHERLVAVATAVLNAELVVSQRDSASLRPGFGQNSTYAAITTGAARMARTMEIAAFPRPGGVSDTIREIRVDVVRVLWDASRGHVVLGPIGPTASVGPATARR